MHRIVIWLKLLIYYLLSIRCSRKATLLDALQTVKHTINGEYSLIRLGDGELNIMEGIDIHYQKAETKLTKEMRKLVDDYITYGEKCGYLLCMPNEYLRCNGLMLMKKRVWLSSWSRFRYVFKKRYDVNRTYGEAFVFAKEYEDIYSCLWKNKKIVIFLHHNKKYADQFYMKYGIKTEYIPIVSKDCYKDIDTIVEEIHNKINETKLPPKTIIALVSAGPCAKIIVYRLKDCGIQIIDTGHCWDTPLALRE